MKRSPNTIKAALTVAAMASGLAASIPAFGGAYITIDLLARPAQIDNARYTNAEQGGFAGPTNLPGYKATAPGVTTGGAFNTTGFSSIITPGSVGQLWELAIVVTLAPEGTTNTFANLPSNATSIANWNPSSGANKTGLFALAFNIVASGTGIQPSFKQLNQGTGYTPDPNSDGGSSAAVQAPQVVISRATANAATLTGSPSYAGNGFDQGTGYSGGSLLNRGTGSFNAQHVVLVNAAGAPSLIGGTLTTGTPLTGTLGNYLAVSYFDIGSMGSGATNNIGLDFSGFATSELLAGLRWRNSTDTVDVNFNPNLAMIQSSASAGDPIIKVNGLTLAGSAASVVQASIVSNPVSGSTLVTGNSVTLTNNAAGGADNAVISNVQVSSTLAANGTWGQVGFVNNATFGPSNGTLASTVTVTPAANLLNGAKANGTLSVHAAGVQTPATGEGDYTYNLSFTKTGATSPTGAGTNFGTPQTAAVAATDTLQGLSSTEAGFTQRTLTFLGSTAIAAGGVTASVEWRQRSGNENWPGTVPPLPTGISSLITDVANVTFPTGTAPTAYAVMMNYDPAFLGGIDEITSFGANHLFLAQMLNSPDGLNGSPADSWRNATIASGNTQVGVLRAYLASDLNTIGSWGVDTVQHTAWAVLPGSVTGQFAVVPEPASLGLLALGALGLMRRRR